MKQRRSGRYRLCVPRDSAQAPLYVPLLSRVDPISHPLGQFQLRDYQASGIYNEAYGNHAGLVDGDDDAWARARYPEFDVREAAFLPGQYHPRIWRNGWARTPDYPRDGDEYPVSLARARRSTTSSLHRLVTQLSTVFDVVEPTISNRGSHGPAIRHLLLLASMEVEAAWRGILLANRYPAALAADARLTTKNYVALLRPMRLDEYSLRLALYHDEWGAPITPFAGWSENSPTESLPWYGAYNAAKHDRESARSRASLDCAVTAVAAACVMMVAQYGGEAPEVRAVLDHMAGFNIDREPEWSAEQLYFPADEYGFEELPLFG